MKFESDVEREFWSHVVLALIATRGPADALTDADTLLHCMRSRSSDLRDHGGLTFCLNDVAEAIEAAASGPMDRATADKMAMAAWKAMGGQ